MQKTMEITIENKKYTIRELRMRQIVKLQNLARAHPDADFWTLVGDFLSEVSDIPREELGNCSGSELEEIVVAIKEVNASFFAIPGHLGLEAIAQKFLASIKEGILKDVEATMMPLSGKASA